MAYIDNLVRVSHLVSSVYPFEGEAKKRFESWLSSKQILLDTYMEVANSYGTAIHKGLENYINNIEEEQPEYEPHLTKYVGFGIQFLKENCVTPIHTEHYIYVPGKYQGTIDLIGEIDGELWVLDWKTWGIAQEKLGTKGEKWKWKKPYDKLKKTRLQLSLYAIPLGIKNIGVVELAADGYHFHKLSLYSEEEIDNIVNNYYLT